MLMSRMSASGGSLRYVKQRCRAVFDGGDVVSVERQETGEETRGPTGRRLPPGFARSECGSMPWAAMNPSRLNYPHPGRGTPLLALPWSRAHP